MPRKIKPVEGIVLDLDDFVSGDVEALIAAAEEKKEKPPPAREIVDSISYTYKCEECNKHLFISNMKIWQWKYICPDCYEKVRQERYSSEFLEYINKVYSSGCTFCDAKYGRFHLDHINMFSKVNSVGCMIESGDTEESIRAEIAKCQLLCISCHGFVTQFEVKSGFIKKKKQLNCAIAAGEDVTERRRELYAEYDAVMTEVYPLIRARVRGGGRVGDSEGGTGRVS